MAFDMKYSSTKSKKKYSFDLNIPLVNSDYHVSSFRRFWGMMLNILIQLINQILRMENQDRLNMKSTPF